MQLLKVLQSVLFALIAGILMAGCVNVSHTEQSSVGSAPYFSVVDFGAKGDGITDDTKAFQKAVNAAAHCGGTVLVPPVAPDKGYVLTHTIQMSRGVSVVGGMIPPTKHLDDGKPSFNWSGHVSRILARPRPDQYEGPKKSPLFYIPMQCQFKQLYIEYDQQPWPTNEQFQDPDSPYYYTSFEAARDNFYKDHIKPYGPTFHVQRGHYTVLEDIHCSGYYDFYFQEVGGKSYLTKIYLAGLGRAFTFLNCAEVNRISGIHYTPRLTTKGPDGKNIHTTWMNGIVATHRDNVGFFIGRSDGYTFQDIFLFGIGTGVRLGASKEYPLHNPMTGEDYYYDPDTKTHHGYKSNYPANGPWGTISDMGIDLCQIGIHFVWPTHLSNRMSNILIATGYDNGQDFPTVAATGQNIDTISKQGAFVVEKSHCIDNNLDYQTTFMCTNVQISSYTLPSWFGPASINALLSNGRGFLIDGDILMDIVNFQMNPPYDEDFLAARGPNANKALVRIRNLSAIGRPLPDIQTDGSRIEPLSTEWKEHEIIEETSEDGSPEEAEQN